MPDGGRGGAIGTVETMAAGVLREMAVSRTSLPKRSRSCAGTLACAGTVACACRLGSGGRPADSAAVALTAREETRGIGTVRACRPPRLRLVRPSPDGLTPVIGIPRSRVRKTMVFKTLNERDSDMRINQKFPAGNCVMSFAKRPSG